MNDDLAVPRAMVLPDAAERLDRDGLRRHDRTQAAAGRARATPLRSEVLTDALAREFEQPERGERLNRRARPVAAQAVLEHLDDLVPRRLRGHVDEIDHDDAADVAQANLAGDLGGRFGVGLDDRILEVLSAGELTRVDVDDGERLGRFDHDGSARGQIDLGFHRASAVRRQP